MAKDVHLTSNELASILANKKVVGAGTEGTCFVINNEVYKIYHNAYEQKVPQSKIMISSAE